MQQSGRGARPAGFHCFAEGQGRAFLGVNYRKPLLTGFNSRDYDHLWHRSASCPAPPTPCDRSVAYSSAPDQNDLQGALLWLPGKRDSCSDVRGTGGENGTVVSLDNNLAVPMLFAALADRAEKHSYFDCLQGQGSLLKHPVCRYNRPLPLRFGPSDVPVDKQPERFRGLWSAVESKLLPPPPPPPVYTIDGDGDLGSGAETQSALGALAGTNGGPGVATTTLPVF